MASNNVLTDGNVDRQVRRKNQPQRVTSKQISAESNLDKLDQKVFKDAEKAADKENTAILRRSKRKVTASSAVKLKTGLSLTAKTKRSKTKNNKNRISKLKTSLESVKDDSTTVTEETCDETQNYLKLTSVAPNHDILESNKSANSNKNILTSLSLNVSDDSGFESSTRVSDQNTEQYKYWMELAEQRRKSLETTLQRNELLHDQLAVLETENCRMKYLIKEAEAFAEILKCNKKYAVVTVVDENSVEVIPTNWLTSETETKWPNMSATTVISNLIKDSTPPSSSWSLLKIKINSFSSSFSKATCKTAKAIDTSHFNSYSSEDILNQPHKRQKPARYQSSNSSSSESESVIANKKYNIPSMPRNESDDNISEHTSNSQDHGLSDAARQFKMIQKVTTPTYNMFTISTTQGVENPNSHLY